VKEWENLQNILKSAAYESLEKIKTKQKKIYKTINKSKEQII
jgi:hypothetical protein